MNYLHRYKKALDNSDFTEIQNIISELNSLDQKSRNENFQLYQQIGEDLFSRDIEISNYNLKDFQRNDLKPPERKNIKVIEDNFQEKLLDFLNKTEKSCKSLKAHFIFQLDNNSTEQTELLILTDNTSKHNPLIVRITEAFTPGTIKKHTIEEFINECKKKPNIQNKKFVCLVAFATNLVADETSHTQLRELFELFKTSNLITLKKTSEISTGDYKLEQITEDTFKYIQSICGKSFNNRDITFQEEIIIKKCFQNSIASIIDYKMLKAGFSGSKVIEVQPLKSHTSQTGRFVIKFGKIDKERKIHREKEAFDNHIDDLNIPGYKGSLVDNDLYAAIKYNYASSDTKTDSHPFAKLLQDHVLGKPDLFAFKDIFDQLFNCDPFKFWNTPAVSPSKAIDLYKDYFHEEKLVNYISLIEGIPDSDVRSRSFWKKIEVIKEIEFEALIKVCHGDLHSENFFKDGSGVYLIDFGYTQERHAVIDHSTLEASIKFKHIPTYIPVEEILEREISMLNIETFSSGYAISSSREVLKSLLGMCLSIRQNALQFLNNKANPLEYYISLFFITLRQIQYPDLNQRYALKSAECLADAILDLVAANKKNA
jgi:Mn2+-dependent serine/threonine protein kinase